MKLNILIVDDEAPARTTLKSMLQKNHPECNVVAECSDLPEAVLKIKELKPHLVFLDVEMPRYSGLDIVRFFDEDILPFQIIFLTGYSQYALQAFELAAIDYLLKPLSPDHLRRALKRAEERFEQPGHQYGILRSNQMAQSPVKMALRLGTGIQIVNLADVLVLEADGSYTTVVMQQGTRFVLSKRLGEFEHLLSHPSFLRPHRSYMVNMDHVQAFQQRSNTLLLTNQLEVPIAADRKAEVLLWIENIGQSAQP